MKVTTIGVVAALGLATVAGLVMPPWHLPVSGRQLSYDGSGDVQFAPTATPVAAIATEPPPPLPPADPNSPPATQVYKNVQVLTDVSAAEFLRTQHAITAWVAPRQGCGFCHAGEDYASDAKPEKQAARAMLRMVRTINTDWRNHVGTTGVTCFTCHRGSNVPTQVWYPRPPQQPKGIAEPGENWNERARTVRDFFADNGFRLYLLEENAAIGESYTALRSGQVASPEVHKRLYEVMMQIADGIGVNCGYCHASRAFYDWEQSTPERWTAFYGIRMTRAINRDTLLPLAAVIPQTREDPHQAREPILPTRETGPQPGNGFVICATCHYARPKPLEGVDMLHDYPALRGPTTNTGATHADATPAPARGG